MNHSIEKILVPLTKCFLILFWLNSFNSFRGFAGVSAVQVQKTHIVKNDDPEPLVLDCDYNLEGETPSLVVKWLKEGKPIYQWIKGHQPTVYPQAKGSIDETFELSSEFGYRAIAFLQPTKELSGVYKCLVETVNSTQSIQTNLQVIDVSQTSIELQSKTLSNDTLVICAVENVYPEPKLLLWTNDDITLNRISETIAPQGNGFYNASVVVSASDVDPDDEIACTLQFSGAEFNITTILKSSASTAKSATIGIMFLLMLVMLA